MLRSVLRAGSAACRKNPDVRRRPVDFKNRKSIGLKATGPSRTAGVKMNTLSHKSQLEEIFEIARQAHRYGSLERYLEGRPDNPSARRSEDEDPGKIMAEFLDERNEALAMERLIDVPYGLP
jgi:MoaA/NifB/PqqE/SkfB family radical SAM enzyme